MSIAPQSKSSLTMRLLTTAACSALLSCGGGSTSAPLVTSLERSGQPLYCGTENQGIYNNQILDFSQDTGEWKSAMPSADSPLLKSQSLFHFVDKQMVVKIEEGGLWAVAEPSISIHRFSESTSEKAIDLWIHNQLYIQNYPASRPIYSCMLPKGFAHLNNVTLNASHPHEDGRIYSEYNVITDIDEYNLDDSFVLLESQSNLTQFIYSNPPSGDNIGVSFVAGTQYADDGSRYIDIADLLTEGLGSPDLEGTLEVFQLAEPNSHAQHSKKLFFNKTVKSVVLINVDSSKTITEQSVELSVHRFEMDASNDSIRNWINQHTNNEFSGDTATPIDSSIVEQSGYSVSRVTLIDSTENTSIGHYEVFIETIVPFKVGTYILSSADIIVDAYVPLKQ